jgi:hypothetical protein
MTRVGPSAIHGQGVFATRDTPAHAFVRPPRGRVFRGYNHSCAPNARIVFSAELAAHSVRRGVVRLLRDVSAGEEITLAYGPFRPCRCPRCV